MQLALELDNPDLLRGIATAVLRRRNCLGQTILHFAAETSPLTISYLKSRTLDIDSKDADHERPLHYAIRAGRLDCVRSLLKCGACPRIADRCGTTPLHAACRVRAVAIVRELLDSGAGESVIEKDNRSRFPWQYAEGCTPILRLLADAELRLGQNGAAETKGAKGTVKMATVKRYATGLRRLDGSRVPKPKGKRRIRKKPGRKTRKNIL